MIKFIYQFKYRYDEMTFSYFFFKKKRLLKKHFVQNLYYSIITQNIRLWIILGTTNISYITSCINDTFSILILP